MPDQGRPENNGDSSGSDDPVPTMGKNGGPSNDDEHIPPFNMINILKWKYRQKLTWQAGTVLDRTHCPA